MRLGGGGGARRVVAERGDDALDVDARELVDEDADVGDAGTECVRSTMSRRRSSGVRAGDVGESTRISGGTPPPPPPGDAADGAYADETVALLTPWTGGGTCGSFWSSDLDRLTRDISSLEASVRYW